jgi:ATP-dependent DNA helicase RecG
MSRQPKSNGCLRIWADEVTVAKIRAGNSIIRNPILVSYIAKGLLPYRGLGSGIKRALDDWPAIDFDDDRDGNLFTATVHRRAIAAEEIGAAGSENQKSSQKIVEIMRSDPTVTIADLAVHVGISGRAVKKQIERLKAQSRIRRIGPDKGGYWEVIA